jgi:hypothetical protein
MRILLAEATAHGMSRAEVVNRCDALVAQFETARKP